MKKTLLAAMALGLVGIGQAQAAPNISQMSDAEFTRFLKKQPLKAYENLSQDEKMIEGDRINSKPEWVDEFNRKSMEAICGPKGCPHPSLQVPQRDLDRAAAYNMERDALNLRRMGMTPETTRKGIWAALHKPNSACAQYIRQLTGDADAPQDGPVASFAESDQMLIMKIEHYGTCERRNLN